MELKQDDFFEVDHHQTHEEESGKAVDQEYETEILATDADYGLDIQVIDAVENMNWQNLIRKELVNTKVIKEATFQEWITIYGNLLLALTHPANDGESAERIKQFIRNLEGMFIRWKVLTAEQVANIRKGIIDD